MCLLLLCNKWENQKYIFYFWLNSYLSISILAYNTFPFEKYHQTEISISYKLYSYIKELEIF